MPVLKEKEDTLVLEDSLDQRNETGFLIITMDTNLSKFQETVKDREAWSAAVHGVTKSQTWLSNWTTIITSKQRHLESVASECGDLGRLHTCSFHPLLWLCPLLYGNPSGLRHGLFHSPRYPRTTTVKEEFDFGSSQNSLWLKPSDWE